MAFTEGDEASIREYGVLPVTDEQVAERTGKLFDELAAHRGEFVLAVTRRWVPGRRVSDGGAFNTGGSHPTSEMKMSQYLAIVENPFLSVTAGYLNLHTQAYVFANDQNERNMYMMTGHGKEINAGLVRADNFMGPIYPDGLNVRNLNNNLLVCSRFTTDYGPFERGPALEVVVGNEAVQQWREEYAREPWDLKMLGLAGLKKLREQTGVIPDYVSEHHEDRGRATLDQFKHMQRALGHEPMMTYEEIASREASDLKIKREAIGYTLDHLDTARRLFAQRRSVLAEGTRVPRNYFPDEDQRVLEREYAQMDKSIRESATPLELQDEAARLRAVYEEVRESAIDAGYVEKGLRVTLPPVEGESDGKTVIIDGPTYLAGLDKRFTNLK